MTKRKRDEVEEEEVDDDLLDLEDQFPSAPWRYGDSGQECRSAAGDGDDDTNQSAAASPTREPHPIYRIRRRVRRAVVSPNNEDDACVESISEGSVPCEGPKARPLAATTAKSSREQSRATDQCLRDANGKSAGNRLPTPPRAPMRPTPPNHPPAGWMLPLTVKTAAVPIATRCAAKPVGAFRIAPHTPPPAPPVNKSHFPSPAVARASATTTTDIARPPPPPAPKGQAQPQPPPPAPKVQPQLISQGTPTLPVVRRMIYYIDCHQDGSQTIVQLDRPAPPLG